MNIQLNIHFSALTLPREAVNFIDIIYKSVIYDVY